MLTVLTILPANIPLKDLEAYIISGLEMRVTRRRNVQLHRGHRVRGRVTVDGAPAADVVVKLHPLAHGRTLCEGFPAWLDPTPTASATSPSA